MFKHRAFLKPFNKAYNFEKWYKKEFTARIEL